MQFCFLKRDPLSENIPEFHYRVTKNHGQISLFIFNRGRHISIVLLGVSSCYTFTVIACYSNYTGNIFGNTNVNFTA